MILIKKAKEYLELKIENISDFWYLSQIIDKGDVVKSSFERKIKIGEKSIKKRYFGSIEVEKLEYDDILRINGIILSEHEEVPKGSHQAMNFKEHDVIKIEKNNIMKFHLDLIEKSHKEKIRFLVVAFDRDDAIFYEVIDNEHKILFKLQGNQRKKDMDSETSDFYAEIIREVNKLKDSYKTIIFSSPAFWKDYLFNKLPADLKKKSFSVNCSNVNDNVISEILKQKELENVLNENELKESLELINEALVEIHKDGNVAYGLSEVNKAAMMGAVKILLVTDELLFEKRDEIEELFKTVESTRGEIKIVNAKNDAGALLKGLTGVVALLKFKV